METARKIRNETFMSHTNTYRAKVQQMLRERDERNKKDFDCPPIVPMPFLCPTGRLEGNKSVWRKKEEVKRNKLYYKIFLPF